MYVYVNSLQSKSNETISCPALELTLYQEWEKIWSLQALFCYSVALQRANMHHRQWHLHSHTPVMMKTDMPMMLQTMPPSECLPQAPASSSSYFRRRWVMALFGKMNITQDEVPQWEESCWSWCRGWCVRRVFRLRRISASEKARKARREAIELKRVKGSRSGRGDK